MNISSSAIPWWGKLIFSLCPLSPSRKVAQKCGARHIFRITNKKSLMYHFSIVPHPPQPSSFVTRAPSFFCENETRHGLTLHYRTRRKGFVYYTMGQIRQVRNCRRALHYSINISDGSLISTCHSSPGVIQGIYLLAHMPRPRNSASARCKFFEVACLLIQFLGEPKSKRCAGIGRSSWFKNQLYVTSLMEAR